jgi:hypothetical protein
LPALLIHLATTSACFCSGLPWFAFEMLFCTEAGVAQGLLPFSIWTAHTTTWAAHRSGA